jgi:hypothetical protein
VYCTVSIFSQLRFNVSDLYPVESEDYVFLAFSALFHFLII